jgi:hypothetical protein
MTMISRSSFFVTLALAASPLMLGAQAPAAPSHAERAPAATVRARVLDPRLILAATPDDAACPEESDAWKDAVTRPRWQYPAIGAVIGVAAGVIHAHAITQGDYVGIPVEPMYVLPAAYGAIGAFVGLLIDSADRERAARR